MPTQSDPCRRFFRLLWTASFKCHSKHADPSTVEGYRSTRSANRRRLGPRSRRSRQGGRSRRVAAVAAVATALRDARLSEPKPLASVAQLELPLELEA